MRQVFTSARIETVEGVAALLNEHGIQTRITQARSYKGNRRGQFSYLDKNRGSTPDPAVWVVLPDDQPKARSLLREAGLMDSTREGFAPSPLPSTVAAHTPVSKASRARRWLLIAVVLVGAMTVLRTCRAPEVPPTQPETSPPATTPAPEDDAERHIVPVDTSLIQTRPSEK
ncbi:MAG TPA: pathogenicity-like protein [Chiayiivirga sp.]|nr:pathogenicity-like protein [Chiayiivirga sp.]